MQIPPPFFKGGGEVVSVFLYCIYENFMVKYAPGGLLTDGSPSEREVVLMNRYDFMYLLTVTLVCITIIISVKN